MNPVRISLLWSHIGSFELYEIFILGGLKSAEASEARVEAALQFVNVNKL